LAFELLAGQARVELTGGKSYEPKLLEEAEKENSVARMDVDPASIKTLVQTAQDWIERVDKATDATEKYVAETRGPLLESIKQAKTFTDGLADSTQLIDKYGEKARHIGEIMHDARDVMARVNTASIKVDETLAKVDEQLSDEKGSTVTEMRTKLQAYQQQAQELNAKLIAITNNLNNLTGEKLRNAEKFISQSRITIQNLNRAVSNFQDDPKSLFGEDNRVPEYEAPK
jgi:phospholipid/cholesterol/gamma-HCH transport system substrate-binding protein